MTELLIIKGVENYFRFTDGGYELCAMNKASVFPLEQLVKAKEWCDKLKKAGLSAKIMKLIITEEPYLSEGK